MSNGDYALARWLPSPNFWPGGDGNDYVVIHATASGGPQTGYQLATSAEFTDGKSKSVHYINDVDGTVYQIVREADSAWGNCCTSGNSVFAHIPGKEGYNWNKCTISIENVKHSSDNSEPLTETQYHSLLALVRDICQRQHIPMQPGGPSTKGILFHHDLDPVNRARCPGTFPYSTFFQDLHQGGAIMPTTTSSGENAVFVDDIDQLEPGETEDACVAFSASNIWHSVQPGKSNPYSAKAVDQMADDWYTKLTGSLDNSNGMSVPQLQEMLRGIGLSFEEIPLSHNPSDDDKVRQALKDGKLVIICAAESSFFDLEIGRPPYSWNTQPFNHCIVGSGLITSGPYANNIWVRDTVAVSGGYPPSTQRPYDIGKIQYVSLHAVIPSWLKKPEALPMSGLPNGATDDGTTIKFSNGLVMVKGFRARYLEMAAAGDIPADDEPLVNEYPCHPVEKSDAAWWGTSETNKGSAQETRYFRFGYSPLKGVRVTYVGQELHWYQQQLTGAAH